jgi:hypothetical protein
MATLISMFDGTNEGYDEQGDSFVSTRFALFDQKLLPLVKVQFSSPLASKISPMWNPNPLFFLTKTIRLDNTRTIFGSTH